MVYKKAPKSSGDLPDSSQTPAHPATSAEKERRYSGIGSSKGFAVGEAHEFVKEIIDHKIAELNEENIEEEIERFQAALNRSEKELKKIERVTTRKIGKLYSDLFQAQIMLLRDPVLIDTITRRIRQELKPAHLCIEQEFEQYLGNF
ncbi:MAG TPA: phosphoenolpyruvate--protein phosphotransferase, partial [Chlorobaculum parvum]|nr:phosphoenolpyruvate--protein phosphotransferase [Chlorobaculum parvum]